MWGITLWTILTILIVLFAIFTIIDANYQVELTKQNSEINNLTYRLVELESQLCNAKLIICQTATTSPNK